MSKTGSATEHLWFLDTLVSICLSESDGSDGISLLDHMGPFGVSPPLHLHHTEDEIFHILEGQFRFLVGEEERHLGPGDTFLAPKTIPHTFRVESKGGRWLTVTNGGSLEQFVRAAGRVADRIELPEPAGTPTPEAQESLALAASKYGIEIVGPPLHSP